MINLAKIRDEILHLADVFRALVDIVRKVAARFGEFLASIAAVVASIAWQIQHDHKARTTRAQRRERRAENRRLQRMLRQQRRTA